MYRKIGWEVYVLENRMKWARGKLGRIVGVGNPRYYIVRFECGRKTWVRKTDISF